MPPASSAILTSSLMRHGWSSKLETPINRGVPDGRIAQANRRLELRQPPLPCVVSPLAVSRTAARCYVSGTYGPGGIRTPDLSIMSRQL
ncbi:MAG: hypothetical protein ACE5E6_10670, partial [Phycisphaerae bacterium]